jgi:hypothetical protein
MTGERQGDEVRRQVIFQDGVTHDGGEMSTIDPGGSEVHNDPAWSRDWQACDQDPLSAGDTCSV